MSKRQESAPEDQRLIEDFLPIEAISAEASKESSRSPGQDLTKWWLSVLHRWWARRPLSACRGAVYASLVPSDQFRPFNGNGDRVALGRANAARFMQSLCKRDVTRGRMTEASDHLRQHNGGSPPRVLDPFAGGGGIPLEAARLGCDAHALELNPVAHLVQLATLVYPARFGHSLVTELRKWSQVVYDGVRSDIGDLYPMLPSATAGIRQRTLLAESATTLVPAAFLWTRTVPCKNCGMTVPLHRQTWLRKKAGRFVAVRPVVSTKTGDVKYELLESSKSKAEQAVSQWRFDPSDLSSGGETECPRCRSAVPTAHVKACCATGRLGTQLMAIVVTMEGTRGKLYLPADLAARLLPDDSRVETRLAALSEGLGIALRETPLPPRGALGFRVQPYGFRAWDELHTTRQLLTLLTFVKHVRAVHADMLRTGVDPELARAVATYLAFVIDKMAERGSNALGAWDNTMEVISRPVSEGKLPMVWDFGESNPVGKGSGSWRQASHDTIACVEALVQAGFSSATVHRGSALALPYADESFDAVITDPPYYDSVPYSYLADFFYMWLKRTVGHLYPEHFAAASSPVKAEAVMDPSRHGRNSAKAKDTYEQMMAQAFSEARRVLKPGAPMVCVYAHKTTSGWATLVDALRRAGFVVTEAWPLDTENPARQRAKESAALATSIFLVARKRDGSLTGHYEEEVRPKLESIVRERIETLWEAGVTGADLIIASVGAGLRAFTKFARVEYASGVEVPAERFLAEVEGVVMETLLEKILGASRAGVSAVDGPSRFYTLWRHTYRSGELEAGEAIVFTYGQQVELDGATGLSTGPRALLERKKVKKDTVKYHLRDYTERGEDEKLGLSGPDSTPAPLIDVLHRLLWLTENRPRAVGKFLTEAGPDSEKLKMLAHALAGAGLKGKTEDGVAAPGAAGAEQAALGKLLASWRGAVEQPLASGQASLFDPKYRR